MSEGLMENGELRVENGGLGGSVNLKRLQKCKLAPLVANLRMSNI